MLDVNEMAAIVNQVTYKPGWKVNLIKEPSGRAYPQLDVSVLAEASRVCWWRSPRRRRASTCGRTR